MNNEQLKSLGLSDDVIQQILDDQGKNFVPKSRFNEANEGKKALEAQMTERDAQMKDLETKAKGNDELQKQIQSLQEANKKQKEAYDGQIHQMKVNNALSAALVAAHAKNVDAVKAMLHMDKYELAEDGSIKGMADAISKVKTENAWAFDDKPAAGGNKPTIKLGGFQPGEGADGSGKGDHVASDSEIIWNAMHGRFPAMSKEE